MKNKIDPFILFNEGNTSWAIGEDGESYLKYDGNLDDIIEEYNLSLNEVEEALQEYEDASKDRIDTEREIREAWKGNY